MQEHDIIVIGGGIAGMSAALTAGRLGRSTVILTGGVPGGELLNIERIEGLPGHEDGIAGFDLCPITQELADAAGAKFVTEQASEITPEGDRWKVTAEGESFVARAVILAMGARILKLGVPGEAEFAGKGVSHCATCDGPLLRGKVAVVAGGGDSGMQEALTLASHVEKVVIVERSDALTGQVPYVEQVDDNPKIEVLTGREITAIEGAAKVEKVRLKDVNSGEESELEAQGVFAFIGLAPNVDPATDLVECDDRGCIRVDAALRTSARGIFAAGNLRSGNSWRAAGAMGDGATAAYSASRYCTRGEWAD
jgi:thioredoxin reductase (NADPH)